MPPPQLGACARAYGQACGVSARRLPMLVISPYARNGTIVSDAGDQTSVLKFAETLFDVPPLASLPEEREYLPKGPRDGDSGIADLLGGFDPARLSGTAAPIPAGQAEIPDHVVNAMPAAMNCSTLGITPVALPGADRKPPAGFNPRAASLGGRRVSEDQHAYLNCCAATKAFPSSAGSTMSRSTRRGGAFTPRTPRANDC